MIEEKNELTGQILSSDNNMSSLIEKKETLEGQLISSGNIIASLIAQKGARGEKGDTGSQGIPGVSPIVTTSKSGKETTITIVDIEGTKTATVNDGLDGSDGQDGEDGYSPEANVTKTGNTATISITDKNGTTTASVSDGNDGNDGYSPSASVTKVGKIATITITDENGTTTAEVRDGEDGQGSGDMLKSTYDTDNNGIVDNAEKVNNHTVDKDVPSTAVFTDENAVWGNITGTISNQTDLNKALKKSQWSSVLYGGDTYCDAYIDGLGGNINDVGYSFMYDFTPCCYSSLNDSVAALTNVPTEYPLILEIFASQKDTMNWHLSDSSHIYKRVRRITDIEGNVYYQKVTFTNYDSSTQSYNETFSNWIKVLDNCNLAETDPVFTASDAYNISSSDIANWNNKSDFSGSYNDLTNKPTIPTVNNATLTIQKNGTTIDTFTANASVDKTVNISVPTNTSDLTNDSGFINNSVNNLTNYYTKSNVYNKTEMGDIFSAYDSIIAGKQGTISEQTDFNAGDIVVNSIRTKNMFDKNNIINNIRLGSSGENVTDTNYFSSYLIQVKPSTTYTLSKGQSSDTLTVYCEYNSSKTFISRSSFITTTTRTFTTSSTTYFLRLSSGKININSLQLEEGSTATTYSPYQNLNGVSQPITIYSGALQGTQSVTLSGVKRYLKIYFTYAKESSAQIITYEIDTLSGKNLVYGSGIGLSSDGSNALNYYISESSYNVTTSLFTHTRAYWLVLPNTSNERNLNGGYIVYKIDTYN